MNLDMESSSRILLGNQPVPLAEAKVEGELVQYDGESFYRITHAEAMKPFFMSIVSDSDHWLFVASNGGMTAGRKTPKLSLFPYTTEDKIVDGARVTGPYTAILVHSAGKTQLWHPFRDEDSLVYREHPATLQERPRQSRGVRGGQRGSRISAFATSGERALASVSFASARSSIAERVRCDIRVLDGLQNLMPADVDEKVASGL